MNKPLNIHTLCGGPFETNSLVLWRETSALIVDPGFLGKPLLEFCREQKLDVAAILCTHGHIDHIFDLALVSEACPKAPVGLHAADEVWAFEPKATSMFGLPPIRRPQEIHRLWKEGETYEDAGIRYSIIETPGHSPAAFVFCWRTTACLSPETPYSPAPSAGSTCLAATKQRCAAPSPGS
jgi:hydroxyacylglutathione hydrolase